jgi:hypothetical protein
MSAAKGLLKCVGRVCGLQGSELHNVYDELKRISTLGPNTQTRKNRLASVSARLNTLRRARAEKKNLLKLNSLRLAYDVLNAQRSNAVINSADLLQKYRALQTRTNKHETEELVEALLNKEIRPIRTIAKNYQLNKYMSNLSRKAKAAPAVDNSALVEMRKSRNVILKQFPGLRLPKDEAMLRSLLDTRRLALLAEVTTEDEVARNARKAAAVEKFITDRISAEIAAANATYGPRIIQMPAPPSSARRSRRKTRKAGRR